MKKRAVVLIIFLLIAQGVMAACKIDLALISRLVAGGDFAGARHSVKSLAQSGDCKCSSLDERCFRIGPDGSRTIRPSNLIMMLNSLEKWNRKNLARCKGMNVSTNALRKAKLDCLNMELTALKNSSTYENAFVYNLLAKSLTEGHAAPLRTYFPNQDDMGIPVDQESSRHSTEARSEKLAKAICRRVKERKVLKERFENVNRHKASLDKNFLIKLTKIEYKIKQMDDIIEHRKNEFKTLTGKSFYPIEWCDK